MDLLKFRRVSDFDSQETSNQLRAKLFLLFITKIERLRIDMTSTVISERLNGLGYDIKPNEIEKYFLEDNEIRRSKTRRGAFEINPVAEDRLLKIYESRDHDMIDYIISKYQEALSGEAYGEKIRSWPILSGFKTEIGEYKDYYIIIFRHTGNPSVYSNAALGMLDDSLFLGFLLDSGVQAVRNRLESHFQVKQRDGLFILKKDYSNIQDEIFYHIKKHGSVMGMRPSKIFLSHKGLDKAIVRDINETLIVLGFSPWLDETAMPAGTTLERGLLNGFSESCAAVFFVTPNFIDDGYLGTEIEYARAEKRKKDYFSIITIVLNNGGKTGTVPDLLEPFVWKEPKSDLEVLREILRALPVNVGDVAFRPTT